MSVVIYILYDFFLNSQLSSCWISEALFCICSKNTSLHSALWKATHCIQPTLKKQLVWDFPLLKLPEHYVFNGRPKKNVWTSVMKVNILRAAERCMLSCCALCGLSETADKRQAAGAALLEEENGDKCQQAECTSSPQWEDNHGEKGDWWLHPAPPSIGAWCSILGHESIVCFYLCLCEVWSGGERWWNKCLDPFTFLWIRNKTMQKYSVLQVKVPYLFINDTH